MTKFKCTSCTPDPEEDNTLQLKVEMKHFQTFDIGKDGSLENCDGDSEQEIFLQCPICGEIYFFENDDDEGVLQLEERYVITRFNLGKVRYGQTDVLSLNDLSIKKKGE